ncbi:MAG: AtpZ/AtpI family protein [Flavobacteriaceae bacterium]|nr:AtpZ/AtpI family protein [Flavobacteriaceae bacterium]
MNHQDQSKKSPKRPLNTYARYSGIAIQMFAIIGIGTYAGVKLDEAYPNKHDAFTVVLSLVSVLMAIVFVIRRILQGSKNDK